MTDLLILWLAVSAYCLVLLAFYGFMRGAALLNDYADRAIERIFGPSPQERANLDDLGFPVEGDHVE